MKTDSNSSVDGVEEKHRTPLKSIRAKCKQCANGSRKEIAECLVSDCALYPYRMGVNPKRKGIGRIQNIRSKTGAGNLMDPDDRGSVLMHTTRHNISRSKIRKESDHAQ